MPSLTDVMKPSGMNLLQYGESGAGKSFRAARFAEFGPVYFFDFDNKIQNIKLGFGTKHPELLNKISFDVYRGSDESVVKAVLNKITEIEKACAAGKPPFATIVFDSWTQWERTYFDHLMAKQPNLGGKGWGESRQTITVTATDKVTIPGTSDHQLKNRAFPELIDRITALPINVIVNCHVKEPMKGPATIQASGETAKTLPKYFNEWHYLYSTGQGFYKVRVKANEDFLANTARTDVQPSGILEKDDLLAYKDQLVVL
jgi:hypothetical protein